MRRLWSEWRKKWRGLKQSVARDGGCIGSVVKRYWRGVENVFVVGGGLEKMGKYRVTKRSFSRNWKGIIKQLFRCRV